MQRNIFAILISLLGLSTSCRLQTASQVAEDGEAVKTPLGLTAEDYKKVFSFKPKYVGAKIFGIEQGVCIAGKPEEIAPFAAQISADFSDKAVQDKVKTPSKKLPVGWVVVSLKTKPKWISNFVDPTLFSSSVKEMGENAGVPGKGYEDCPLSLGMIYLADWTRTVVPSEGSATKSDTVVVSTTEVELEVCMTETVLRDVKDIEHKASTSEGLPKACALPNGTLVKAKFLTADQYKADALKLGGRSVPVSLTCEKCAKECNTTVRIYAPHYRIKKGTPPAEVADAKSYWNTCK